MLTHLLLLVSSLAFTQYDTQEWGSITSLLTPTGIQITKDGIVYASTSDGLLQFDPNTEKFTAIKMEEGLVYLDLSTICLLYTSPSPRDRTRSRMPSSA